MAGFFDYYALAALGCFLCISIGRAAVLHIRGIRVAGTGSKRSNLQRVEDFLSAGCPMVRSYEIVAFSWPLGFHLAPPALHRIVVGGLLIKTIGATLWAAALTTYALALGEFGTSYRHGIDSITPGELVTSGVFAWTRNPIYCSFGLMAVGTFLLMGQLVFLLLAAASVPLLIRRIIREEKFLSAAYGDSYRAYCSRVGRFTRWF